MKNNIIKVKEFQKTLICLLVIFAMLFGIAIGKFMNANANEITYEYESDNIGYDSTNNTLSATNVKEAIDELYEKIGKCPTGQFCYNRNMLFVKAYIYNENSCVNGSESGCEVATCVTSNGTTCDAGTIIDYKVNDTEIVRFHVLYDNGTTMTLQAQRNTVYSTAWYSGATNHKEGPQTIMAELKTKTSNWTNVKDITLEDGMTEFNDGTLVNNKCDAISCSLDDSSYGYPYSKLVNNSSIGSTVKARMITITETAALGCTSNSKSCPIYLYNYLYDSESYCRVSGKCTNDTHTENGASYNNGYWTLGARSSDTRYVWYVYYNGNVNSSHTTTTFYGARAVVVIDK